MQAIKGYQLSLQQKRLWQLQQQNNGEYFRHQVAVRLQGNLNFEKLQKVIAKISQQTDILRTIFQKNVGIKFPFQVIAETGKLPWDFCNLEAVIADDQTQKIAEIWHQVTAEHPFKVTLIKLGNAQHLLIITLPALCADTKTLDLLVSAIRDGYENLSSLETENIIQYLQVSEWQHELLAETDKSYWLQPQFNQTSQLILPTQTASPTGNQQAYDAVLVPETLSEKLKIQVDDLEDWLLTTWVVLLWRLTQQTEIVINYGSDGRPYEEIEKTLGTLSKWLPLNVSLAGALDFQELLEQIQLRRREILDCQDQWDCNPHLEANVSFAFHDWSFPGDADGVSFSLERLQIQDCPAQLQLACHRTDKGLMLQFHYNSQQFTPIAIERLQEEYFTLLESSLNQPRTSIAHLNVVGEQERQQLLVNWNQTQQDFATEDCLHARITQQAQATPGAIALRLGEQFLTYQELNERANQLAHYLQQQGIGTETLVGICLERSLEGIISLLAILKAGAAYVPLDPGMPPQRLSLMLADAPVALVLTQSQWCDKLPDTVTQVCLDTQWRIIAEQPTHNPNTEVKIHHLAYVIFTSGSTGKPKGVAVEHRGIMNYVDGIIERLQLPPGASYATVSTLGADLGNTAVFSALCTGGTLHIFSQEQVSDPVAFTTYCQSYPIDCLKIVPSHLAVLLSTGKTEDILPKQQLILGGEVATWDLIEQVRENAPNCQIFNHYGPTESTIGVLTYLVTEKVPTSKTVPLGRPLPNIEIYLLDQNLQPVPIGVPGEIYIGGAGLARGYYNQPELTAQRFISHPFQENCRLYQTGDQACYHPDGTLEFLGRVDQQIKIRGFRVELGEIEAQLREHPQIEEAVVAYRTDEWNGQHLDAYFAPGCLSGEEIRNFLRDRIPEYMIPSTFTPLSVLPRTASGKVDRQSLPAPNLTNEQQDYIAPRNSIESAIVEILSELLHLEQVSINANFFDLGGHSLLATQVMSRLRSTFGVEIPLRYLFEAPTIAELAALITQELAQQTDMEQLLSELEDES